MNEQPKLGQLLTGTEGRDCIHVAIVPVVAGNRLEPGDRVCVVDGKADWPDETYPAIGIVDPFLIGALKEGECFYLFLFPGTITGMRHVWTHPAFKPATAPARTTPPAMAEENDVL